jgi:hypothetical protein
MKPHGNTGKRNAMRGEEPADTHIHIRATKKERRRWKGAAIMSGETFSAWIRRHLNRAAQ